MKSILLTIFCIILFHGYSQNESKNVSGILVYYGDYLIFYPEIKHSKSIKRTLKKISKVPGVNLLGTCIPDPIKFCSAFESYIFDQTESLVKWKFLFVANVKVEYKIDKLTEQGFNVNFESVFKKEKIKIRSEKVIYNSQITTYTSKSNGELMFEEFKETPPQVLINCE